MKNSLDSKYIFRFQSSNQEYIGFDINKASIEAGFSIKSLPYSLRILFENVIRGGCTIDTINAFKEWLQNKNSNQEIDFMPARVLMQDFTGVPAVVDLAAMRDACVKSGKDPQKINPQIPVDLVIDHSVQVHHFGNKEAYVKNVEIEMLNNLERYEFLKWGQNAFSNFRVVPPGTGICHQVNLEYLAKVICTKDTPNGTIAYPDTLVGTDSHTTMVNGLAVLGWGVGGIEAEAAMLNEPLPMIIPEVIGVKLTGKLKGTITATDLVLTVTEILRKKGVVGQFVEFFGEGISNLSLADRATIANMAPEYGATCGFFPIDQETIKYLELTARSKEQIDLISTYAKIQSLWYEPELEPEYTDIVEINLEALEPSLAGPRRPQDRISLTSVTSNFVSELPTLSKGDTDIVKKYQTRDHKSSIGHGDVVIAAITSCTNTSNPSVMIAAGLLAKKAVEAGLVSKPWVKTSLAPGSKVVTEYLKNSGLDKYLDKLGFNLVGYGCTTCIGNSGPLDPQIEKVITENKLVVASVLSGNRNFEGRVHPLVRANYLASPPLVVAYAIVGSINIDVSKDPIGLGSDGKNIYLKDIWPSITEISECISSSVNSKIFAAKYQDVFLGDKAWQSLHVDQNPTYKWNKISTYINNPPYFENISSNPTDIKSARILAIFGDSITTDHISPAGNIAQNSPAAKYLIEKGIDPINFNSYGARRGNHEVMMRGTFANVRIKNEICNGIEGGVTINWLTKEQTSIYDAAMYYKSSNIPLIIFAGKEYGTGSSRDWAAKGTNLLGVKAVIAESFERIHRSNLVGMGVLPLVFTKGISRKDLKLIGSEEISVLGIDKIAPHCILQCQIIREDGSTEIIDTKLQVFTENEIQSIKHGSIMHAVVANI